MAIHAKFSSIENICVSTIFEVPLIHNNRRKSWVLQKQRNACLFVLQNMHKKSTGKSCSSDPSVPNSRVSVCIFAFKFDPWKFIPELFPYFLFQENFTCFQFRIPGSMHIKEVRHDGMVLIRSFSHLPYFSGYCSMHLFNIAFFRLNLNYEPIIVISNFLLIDSSSIDRRKQCLPRWFWRVWLRSVWLLNLNLWHPQYYSRIEWTVRAFLQYSGTTFTKLHHLSIGNRVVIL